MTQKMKKGLFKIIPTSVVSLMVLSLVIVGWQGAINVNAAALSSTDVQPATLIASATSLVTISFTTVTTIPADGKIKITFPAGYDVTGATGGTCSTMDGGFSTSVALQVVTITRDTLGTPETAGAEVCTVSTIVNPSTAGSTGTYTIETTDNADAQLDVDAAVAADTIVDFITTATTADVDADGQIDAIVLALGEDVTGGSVAGTDFTVTIPAYTVASASRTAASQITIVLTESGSPDTSVTPTVTVVSSISPASGGDVSSGTELSVDGAMPILLSFSSTTGAGTYGPGSLINLTATYSENISSGAITVDLNNTVTGVVLATISTNTISDDYTVGATGSGEDVTNLDVSAISAQSASDGINTNSTTTMPASTLAAGINVDTTAPTVTTGNFTIDATACTGLAGECIIGDTITLNWDNSVATGDNNPDVTVVGDVVFDASRIGGSGSLTATSNALDIYSASFVVALGIIDGTLLDADVVVTDDYGNTAALVTSSNTITVDNIAPIITVPGSVTLTNDVNSDGIASIGDEITYADGSVTVGDTDTWTVDLSAYGLSATATAGAYPVIADNDDNVAFSATETVTDDAGNIDTGSSTISGFTNIDNVAPTLSTISIVSDNAVNTAFAKAGDTVTLSFTASETLGATPVVTFQSGAIAVANLVTVLNPAGNDWTASYVVDPTDTDGSVTFTIDYVDVALNAGAQETTVDDASSVTVDLISPAISQIDALVDATPTYPSVTTNNWYYYAGGTIYFTVSSNEPLSAAKACVKSISTDTIGSLCSNLEFAGAPGTNYIDFDTDLGGNEYRFSLPVATYGEPTTAGGYGMNLYLVDAAGNAVWSTAIDGSDSFNAVFGINGNSLPGLDGTTTDWSSITDFTSVTNLTFEVTGAGKLVITDTLNLTSTATITELLSLAGNITIGGGVSTGTAVLGLDSAALTAFDYAADLTITVPGATQPGIVVYGNDGTTIDGFINNDGTISGFDAPTDTITVNGWAGNELTFSTTGFSYFGTDNTAPTVTIYSPSDNATGVAIASNLVLTFSENVVVGTGNVVIRRTSDSVILETIDITSGLVTFNGTTGVTINPSVNLVNGIAYNVQIDTGAILDTVGNDYAGIADTTTWNFTSVAASSGGGGSAASTSNLPTGSIKINSDAAATNTRDVTINVTSTNATQMMISESINFDGAVFVPVASSATLTLSAGEGMKTVYVYLKNADGISNKLSDSIEFKLSATPAEVTPPVVVVPPVTTGLVLQDPTPAAPLPVDLSIGMLVKLSGLPAVYFIDNDNRRHAFPNLATFYSWFPDFSNVQTISTTLMAQVPLGSNVTMRPGTFFVKITTDPKVYAVESYGVLRWIPNETTAIALFGANWAGRVVDVSDAFFSNYQTGTALTSSVHPNGSLIQYQGESNVYYIDNGLKSYVSSNVFTGNRFQNQFKSTNISSSISYTSGSDMTIIPLETLMKLR